MADTSAPEPVKYFVAILFADETLRARVIEDLAARWGHIDFAGADHPFDATTYYEPEMGAGLRRRLVSFAPLRSPEELADAKLTANALEASHAEAGKRRVNLDMGYLDHNKIVLASAKPAGQKIYLRRGIYADLIARFAHGSYQPFAWTFPDFKTGRYDTELLQIRDLYLRQRKAPAQGG